MDLRTKYILLLGPAGVALLLIGMIIQPELVYDRFIWQYFWGPVMADASGGTAVHNGVTAYSGYTLVSEVGYGMLLAYALLVVVTVLQRWNVGTERRFVLAFLPFIVGGGMLRVVEDVATDHAVFTMLLPDAAQYLLISPVIYMTMFGIVITVLAASIYLDSRGIATDYKQLVAAGGTLFAAGIFTVLVWTAGTVPHRWIVPAVLGLSVTVLGATYAAARVTGYADVLFSADGAAILFGHILDGSSTAVSLDRLGYAEKHPVVDAFIGATGTPYTFILLKVAVIAAILYYISGDVRDEDPLFTNLVLLGILSIGLGPGVRNLTRAALGV